ncbi:MAG TPA: CRTAC1 family protein [Bryobacteraceae bacterium]|nr:CRTAC1 family protein [Bryobacteraceae bacterium]
MRHTCCFIVVTVTAICLLAGYTLPEIQFSDATAELKLEFRHENSATSQKYLIETMGGGVALLDYNGDSRLDIFFTNGARLLDPMPAGAAPDKSAGKYWNRLYRQNSEGTFTDVTEKAGVSGAASATYSMGVAVADFDNDGRPDLYVTGYPRNMLYRNNGDGTFSDVTARAGVAGGGWSASAGFFDYDRDGQLDLFVTRYLDWSFEKNIYCGEKLPGRRAYCHPDNFAGITNLLFRNNGNGTFTDVSRKAGISDAKGKGLGVAFADYDLDGWTDVYVANDSVQCFLYRNKGDGGFEDVSLVAGAGFNADGRTFAGMGVDFADYDNDGRPDIIVTDLSNEMYVLFRNDGEGTFSDVTAKAGLARATLLHSGWGTRFVDVDNDGWRDLFVAQGHVLDTIQHTSPNLRYLEPPLLLRNERGRFTPVEAAGKPFTKPWAGRGAAFGDIDNDGDIDMVVANCGQPAYVLRNETGSRNRWLGLRLTGTRSNRDAIGARVSITDASGLRQVFEVSTASSYLSASDKRILAGLGQATAAKLVEIAWPSGAVQRLEGVRTNQVLNVSEPRAQTSSR